MSLQDVNAISNRLSLRTPQRESLEILARVCEIATLSKDADPAVALEAIKSEFETVTDFERDFPSLCFALATGVGKTRLMGAFITYLYQSEGIRNFFVLAPNLTIYNKLIADFTPNTPKYVFKGIGEFAQTTPLIITGDTYESAVSARGQLFDNPDECHINIFNISKINSEVRGGKSPRIKRLSEYIGQSYFDYLAGLPDLVMLMDESHRYRASAGVKAINELNPILGLELTATPQIEKGGNSTPFENVIYAYPLASAMDDGFVKEPAVATRENFDKAAYSDEGLEKLKLEDGVRIHEYTKVELEAYARNNDKPIVKPFILVVATDTEHANLLQEVIEADCFFDGQYKGKVIQVHSNLRGEVKDEIVEQLLTVEDPDNPVEIVIHVNMLKEGWDVTNLYTIVPLRAANSKTLVEQSIGRGLRLPYGKRVGVPAVDRLTIVSHDRFQEIVDHDNDPNSIIRTGLVIGRDIPDESRKAVEVKSIFEEVISGELSTVAGEPDGRPDELKQPLFEKPEEIKAAKATYEIIKRYERLKGSDQLQDAEIQKEITQQVQEIVRPAQGTLEGVLDAMDMAEVVQKTTELYCDLSIDVPKIVVVPKGEASGKYEDFDLDVRNIKLQPVAQDILIQHLHENQQYRLKDGTGVVEEDRLEDYLVRGLIDFDDISYDDHAALLYKLSGQVVSRLQEYAGDEDAVLNILQYHQQTLVRLIHSQMQEHFVEEASEYEAHVTRGFYTLRENTYTTSPDENARDFRATIPDGQKSRIRSMAFRGFGKCLYRVQKFDTDPERRFAVLLENEEGVQKWFKPGRKDFQIDYSQNHQNHSYEPDFVVETKDGKFLCEPKQAREMENEEVLAKAEAAAVWCEHATEHAEENGGKPWKYLLIPHDKIQSQMTLEGLAAQYEVKPRATQS